MKYNVVLYFLSLLIFGLFTYYWIQWTMTASNGMTAMTNLDVAERQIIRKKIMKEYCLTQKDDTNPYRSRQNMGYIIVDDKHKIMYCTIPKVGTTTWKRVLASLRGLKRGIYVHRWDLWKRLYQYTEEERAIRIQTYFKFLFVREPLHRLLSAFKDKFIGNDLALSRNARKSIVGLYRPQDLGRGNNMVSFPEFIRYFSKNIPRNQHWREYGKLCHPCYVNYDFIGHLETLEEDAPLVLKMAGIDDRVTYPPVHGSTRTDEILKYFSQVSPEDITRIGELYRDDFEMFGYEFLGPVKPLLKLNFTE